MSLYKQLWIGVALLMLMVFGVTFVINGVSSSRYLEQQLSLKNQDDATALALSLSQQQLDPVLLELQLAAKLDQGSYEFIEFRDPKGDVVFNRGSSPVEGSAPGWLQDLFPISSVPGEAEVTNGWNQFGALTLKSHDGFAYEELWNGAQRNLIALVLAIVIAGAVGSLLLRIILSPLNQVVDQARAIGERRFSTLPEPFTREFAVVTRSMNELARRVREMLERESQRLSRQREVTELDATTGTLQRDPFMGRMRAKLESEGIDANGSVALVRIGDLARLNQLFGRQTLDNALKDIGAALRRLTTTESSWVAGRLNGSDFCLLAPGENQPKRVGDILQKAVMEVLKSRAIYDKTDLPTACIEYASGDTLGELLTSLDGALLSAREHGDSAITVASPHSGVVTPVREQADMWQTELLAALEDNRLLLQPFPVVDSQGVLIHQEGMVRIRMHNEIRSAGEFMPWVHRLNLGGEIDRAVVKLAIESIAEDNRPTCVNLTSNSLTDASFATWIEDFLLRRPAEAAMLSIEVDEAPAYAHTDGFRRLSRHLHATSTRLGIEHMGYRISDIGKLGELGVDYIKVDGLFVRDIQTSTGNTALFRTYVTIAQSLGLPCIAEGVSHQEELTAVFDLGADGVCGKGVTIDD